MQLAKFMHFILSKRSKRHSFGFMIAMYQKHSESNTQQISILRG